MAVHTLGTVTISPQRIDGFGYAQAARRIPILAGGSSTHNEVLQQGGEPSPEARLSGKLTDPADVATLLGYSRTKETVAYDDPVTPESRSVYVFEFSVQRRSRWLWEYDLVIVEVAP